MYKRGKVWWTKITYRGKLTRTSLNTSDKRLAKSIEAKIRIEIVEGRYFDKLEGEYVTVKELIERYLNDHSKPNKATNSYKVDTYWAKRIIQHFGKRYLTDVSAKHISSFIKKRRKDGVTDVTIRHELVLMRHAFNLAIEEWELIKASPFTKKSIPKADVERVRYLSEDEEKKLFQFLPEWIEPIVTIARETGLRLSNIANLRWSQLNLFNKAITIEEGMKNGDPIGIPMTENVFETLKGLNKVRRIDSDFVFCKNGKPYTRGGISKAFKNTCRKAGIDDLHFHDLRHDFCSRLVQRGVPLYTVAALAGHRDIKMTQRYAHLSPEGLRSAIEVLNYKQGHNLGTMGGSR